MAEKPAAATGKALAGFNFVANDQIWKDHIRYEETAAKRWPEYWGFLGGSYKELVKDDFVKKEVKKIELPPPLVLPPITPISRYIKVLPSPQPFPQTTASKIGWRSAHPQHSLEIYGKYAKPKGGLIKQLNWPPEGVI
ncbi:ciliary microtubule inner protein 1-like [Diadema antillarum]|uniref:ciliary microtubule inner protein 1-like n=1 Tax=Diadema antillarum TaxID=105358 RepID=UPI003A88EFC2